MDSCLARYSNSAKASLKSKVDLVFQQAKELDRRNLILQEQETELDQVNRENETLKHELQNWHEED